MPEAAALSVLVVDDQVAVRALVKQSLMTIGVKHITEAGDGQEALHRMHTNQIHLVISDVTMPRMDGLALLKAVRADPRMKQLGFIMLTSRGEVELVKQAIELGVNNYITKPFAIGALRKKIESVFGPLT